MRRRKSDAQSVFDFEETADAPVLDTMEVYVPEPEADDDEPERAAEVEIYHDPRRVMEESTEEVAPDLEVYEPLPNGDLEEDLEAEEAADWSARHRVATAPKVEPIAATAEASPELPLNPEPAWRGIMRSKLTARRFYLLSNPSRISRQSQVSRGSLFEIVAQMVRDGLRPPVIPIRSMDGLLPERGGIKEGDVFIFLSTDQDLVHNYAQRHRHWARGVFVHCVANGDTEDLDMLRLVLRNSGCEDDLLQIVAFLGDYKDYESTVAAKLLWDQIRHLYIPQEGHPNQYN